MDAVGLGAGKANSKKKRHGTVSNCVEIRIKDFRIKDCCIQDFRVDDFTRSESQVNADLVYAVGLRAETSKTRKK